VIHAGQAYLYEGQLVLAMEGATRGRVRVRRRIPEVPVIQCGPAFYVDCDRLEPTVMKYHGNAVPGESK